MLRRLLPIALLFVLLLPLAHAGEPEAEADDDMEYVADVPEGYLGRNLKLTFELQPLGNDDRPWAVHTATHDFAVNVSFTQPMAQFRIIVEGTVHEVEVNDEERILVVVDTELEYSGDGNVMAIKAHGSRAVLIGAKTTLATLGDKTLVVLVEEVTD